MHQNMSKHVSALVKKMYENVTKNISASVKNEQKYDKICISVRPVFKICISVG